MYWVGMCDSVEKKNIFSPSKPLLLLMPLPFSPFAFLRFAHTKLRKRGKTDSWFLNFAKNWSVSQVEFCSVRVVFHADENPCERKFFQVGAEYFIALSYPVRAETRADWNGKKSGWSVMCSASESQVCVFSHADESAVRAETGILFPLKRWFSVLCQCQVRAVFSMRNRAETFPSWSESFPCERFFRASGNFSMRTWGSERRWTPELLLFSFYSLFFILFFFFFFIYFFIFFFSSSFLLYFFIFLFNYCIFLLLTLVIFFIY